ncbi:hypothetical protein BMS3Abin04_00612 [bacterium BMS3Abin04]|nr:hypothetical protein BMS3Abin04_00612 [bacterium BMS3Abin04]
MKILKFTFIIVLLLAPQFNIFAQKDSSNESINIFNLDENSKPFIELNYGISTVRHKNVSAEFKNPGLTGIKIGYTKINKQKGNDILEENESYIFASYLASDLNFNTESGIKVNPDGWNFGLGNRDGFGYKLNNFAIIPYMQSSIYWSNLKVSLPDVRTFNGDFYTRQTRDELNYYNGSFRFGTRSEAGIDLKFGQLISISGAYETAVIFPRHLFWKQAGSYFLESFSLVVADYFVEEVMNSSPAAGPIVNFFLKNGLSYAFYQLKRDKMNWPFASAAPLTYETFKIGLKFTF